MLCSTAGVVEMATQCASCGIAIQVNAAFGSMSTWTCPGCRHANNPRSAPPAAWTHGALEAPATFSSERRRRIRAQLWVASVVVCGAGTLVGLTFFASGAQALSDQTKSASARLRQSSGRAQFQGQLQTQRSAPEPGVGRSGSPVSSILAPARELEAGRSNSAVAKLDVPFSPPAAVIRPRKLARHGFAYWLNRGQALYGRGRSERALHAFGRAAELRPAAPDPHSQVGFCFLGLRRPSLARAAFRRALRLDRSHVSAHFGLAEANRRLGYEEQAIAGYKRFLRDAPADAVERSAVIRRLRYLRQ